MHYEITKRNESAPWVLFIHGLGGSIATWKYQMDDFKNNNILCVDLQGHGKSAFVKSCDSEDPSKAAAVAINDILIQEKIDTVNIVALSLGTIVAMEFAVLYSNKVSSMILGGSVLNLNVGRRMLLWFVEALKYLLPVKWMYPIFAKVIMPKKNHKKSRDIFVRESLKLKQEAFMSWVKNLMHSQKKFKYYSYIINKKKIPTLFITGSEDYLFKSGVRNMRERIKNFQLALIAKCGHVCSIEKHDTFNKLALDFLHKYQNQLKFVSKKSVM